MPLPNTLDTRSWPALDALRAMHEALPLAQSEGNGIAGLVGVLAVLVPIAAALLFLLAMVRRRLKHDDDVPRDFTLGDLRRLRDQGKMTDEELERAKAALVGRVHSKLAEDAKPTPDVADVKGFDRG